MITVPAGAVLLVGALAPRLADEDPNSEMKGLIDDAGPIAGLFVLALGISLYFLWRSLNKQMKKIDASLPEGPDDRERRMDREATQEAVERGDATGSGADEPTAS